MRKLLLYITASLLFIFTLCSCKRENIVYIDLYINDLPETVEVTGGDKTIARLHTGEEYFRGNVHIGKLDEYDYYIEFSYDFLVSSNSIYEPNKTYNVLLEDLKKGETKTYDVFVPCSRTQFYWSWSNEEENPINLTEKFYRLYPGLNVFPFKISTHGNLKEFYDFFYSKNLFVEITCDDPNITIINPERRDNNYYLVEDELAYIKVYNGGKYKDSVDFTFTCSSADEIIDTDSKKITLTNEPKYIEFTEKGWYKISSYKDYDVEVSYEQYKSEKFIVENKYYEDTKICHYVYIDFYKKNYSRNIKDRFIYLKPNLNDKQVVIDPTITIEKINDDRLTPYDIVNNGYNYNEEITGFLYKGMKTILKFDGYSYLDTDEIIHSDNVKYTILTSDISSLENDCYNVFLIEPINDEEECSFTFQLNRNIE